MRPKILGSSLSIPLASDNGHATVFTANYTEDMPVPRNWDDSSSSVIALMVVLTLACTVIMTSLVTFYCHKLQLKGRKLKKAQEEYEKDHGKNNKQQSTGTTTVLQNP